MKPYKSPHRKARHLKTHMLAVLDENSKNCLLAELLDEKGRAVVRRFIASFFVEEKEQERMRKDLFQ